MMHNPEYTMNQFYSKVIQDFGTRLFNRYNQKEQGFDSQVIDQIKTRVIAKMMRPQELFNKALQIKHRSTSSQVVVQISNVKKQEPVPSSQQNLQEQIDYANAFGNNDIEVKKEEGLDEGMIKHEPNEDLDDEKDEQDEREKRQMIEKLKNNLCVHIVGTYEPRNKKHVAKDQSTRLELENVFIKHKSKSTEIFVPKLICEFKKE